MIYEDLLLCFIGQKKCEKYQNKMQNKMKQKKT